MKAAFADKGPSMSTMTYKDLHKLMIIDTKEGIAA